MHASQRQHQTYLSLTTTIADFFKPFFPSFLSSIRPRMFKNEHFFFLSSIHGNKGVWMRPYYFFFITMLIILFFLTYITSITCWRHVSTHSMAGHYILGRGNLTCKSPFSSTCTNRSSCIDLSHFKIFSYKSY